MTTRIGGAIAGPSAPSRLLPPYTASSDGGGRTKVVDPPLPAQGSCRLSALPGPFGQYRRLPIPVRPMGLSLGRRRGEMSTYRAWLGDAQAALEGEAVATDPTVTGAAP